MSHKSGCLPQDPVENCNELVAHALPIIFHVCPATTMDLADLCSLQAASTACRAAVKALPGTNLPRCVTLTRGRQQLDDFCAFLPALSSRNFALTLTGLVITSDSPTGFNDWGMWHAALGPVLSQLTQLQSLMLRGAEADPKVTVRNNAVCSTPALPSSVISCIGGMSHLTCLELSVVRPADVQKLPPSLVQAKLSDKLLQDDFQQHHHDGMCLVNGVWTMLVPLRLDRMMPFRA